MVTGRQRRTIGFEVEHAHTYFVGDLTAWVHNACTPPVGEAPPGASPALRNSPWHEDNVRARRSEYARANGQVEPPGIYRFDGSAKHFEGKTTTARNGESSGPAPTNGQRALDNSVEYNQTPTGHSKRRIGVDPETKEIVVLDATRPEVREFHGHVQTWEQLRQEHKNALVREGLADHRGNIPPRR